VLDFGPMVVIPAHFVRKGILKQFTELQMWLRFSPGFRGTGFPVYNYGVPLDKIRTQQRNESQQACGGVATWI
jgi:hypothetical protein